MSRNTILLGIALLGPVLYAADGAGQTRSVAELKTFYQANCASCHGEDGSARAASGEKLKGADFTDAKEMQGKKEAALAKTIRKGVFLGLGMPSFKNELSETEAALLVREVIRKVGKGRKIGGSGP